MSGVGALVQLLAVRHELDRRDGLDTATMVSGYPGSPLGTFDLAVEQAAKTLDDHRVLHRPGLNEELAAATVWGSQMGSVIEYSGVDGVAGVWYGKAPGLDRSGDALKHGNAMGSGPNGGVVLFCGDDPTAKSSTLTCDSQQTFEDACIPVLYPGDPQDALDLGVHAFRMSRYAGCWVGLKVVTAVADGIATVDLDPSRHDPSDPADFTVDGRPWRHRALHTIGPHQIPDQEVLVVSHRLAAAQAYARHNRLDRFVGAEAGARLGIVCAGKTYFDVVQALADMGHGVDELAAAGIRILKLALTWPVVPETVLDLAGSVEEILVVEEKRPFVEAQLRSILHEAGIATKVVGKRDRDGHPLVSQVGELEPSAVAAVLRRTAPWLEPAPAGTVAGNGAGGAKTRLPLLQLAARAPGFCSGCPHNRSTVFPDDALVGGGVGCHGIMYFEARHQGMKAMPPTPMGAEGVPWIGLSPFVEEPHLIQNLGDGTLSHSGTLAIRASVAAGVDVTFKILYNSAVAMTGGQDVTGLLDVPSMTRALQAEGVKEIVVCAEDPSRYGRHAAWAKGVSVLGRDHLPEVQERLRQVPGVTVIIYDQRCAAEARRLRRKGVLPEPPRRVVINEAVCEGCGDCSVKSNCLSVLPLDTEMGEKRQIHDPSCNRDYTCLEGDCPSFVTVTPKRGSKPATEAPQPRSGSKAQPGSKAPAHDRPGLPSGALPDPAPAPVERQYGIYFTGIGGTGVVTANRILAAAAEAAGFTVGGMDQTGLSQKAGAVVSHLHFARGREGVGSPMVGAAGADLYISGDILQAAGEKNLDKVEPGRTFAVVDRDFTPTAGMLQTDAAPPDVSVLEQAIADRVGADRSWFVDSRRIAEDLLGNHMLGNVVLLGVAFQAGALPFSTEDIAAAMSGRGREAASSSAAFEWGRWAVHDPAAVRAALAEAAGAAGSAEAGPGAPASIFDPSPEALSSAVALVAKHDLPAELRELVLRRSAQVVDYQDAKLAGRYIAMVDLAARNDDAARGWALTRAVIEAWFKLLTYKDEYEVARLHLKVDYDKVAADLGIDGPYKVTYHLHPPSLRRLGLKKKLPMGKPYEVSFRALRAMKRLRGTPLDPFGRDPDRKLERAVIEEYRSLLAGTIGSSLPYETQVRLAGSAMDIKGYAGIKEAAVERWRHEVADLRASTQAASSLGESPA